MRKTNKLSHQGTQYQNMTIFDIQRTPPECLFERDKHGMTGITRDSDLLTFHLFKNETSSDTRIKDTANKGL